MARQVARPAARLTVLSGPSGVGRHRITGLARARSPSQWCPVPLTTRPPRPGERQGVDYEFVDPAEFDRLDAAGRVLAPAHLGPHRYGIARDPIATRLDRGEPVLLSIDLPSATRVRWEVPPARLVLLVGPEPAGDGRLDDDGPAGGGPAAGGPAAGGPSGLAEATGADAVVVADSVQRAAAELVRLLGSSALL